MVHSVRKRRGLAIRRIIVTIAACHVCPEGVVLGTDSTSSLVTQGAGARPTTHYLDFEQKIFEVGRSESLIGLATWGAGRVGGVSHRLIAAQLGEQHRTRPFASLEGMADWLGDKVTGLFESEYGAIYKQFVECSEKLRDKPGEITEPELKFMEAHQGRFGLGYFLAGRTADPAECQAFAVEWSIPEREGVRILPVESEKPCFMGVPHIMQRLVFGTDQDVAKRILQSGKWSGSPEELVQTLRTTFLTVNPELLPLRDAIDWIHMVISTTSRSMKFAGQHMCGGSPEVATVTVDRPFRWVCHKGLDAAIINAQEGVRRRN